MNFTIFSKNGCPSCAQVKKVLELTGSKFVVYTLDEHFNTEAFYEEFGFGSTFPQVVCDGKTIGGSVETVEFLRERKIISR